jgi:hypothetical protein
MVVAVAPQDRSRFIANRSKQRVLVVRSRPVRVAGIAWTDGAASVRASRPARADKRRWTSITEETRRDPRSRARVSGRTGARSSSVRVIVVTPSDPSVQTAREEEGREPRAFHQMGRGDRAGEGGNAVEQRGGPAVKTNSPSLSPRGAEHAVGSIRAWGEIRAAGPTHKRLYSHSGRLRPRTRSNVGLAAWRWRSAGSGGARVVRRSGRAVCRRATQRRWRSALGLDGTRTRGRFDASDDPFRSCR